MTFKKTIVYAACFLCMALLISVGYNIIINFGSEPAKGTATRMTIEQVLDLSLRYRQEHGGWPFSMESGTLRFDWRGKGSYFDIIHLSKRLAINDRRVAIGDLVLGERVFNRRLDRLNPCRVHTFAHLCAFMLILASGAKIWGLLNRY